MSHDPYSREGIARTAELLRRNASKRGKTMTTEESQRRVREAIRKTPTAPPTRN